MKSSKNSHKPTALSSCPCESGKSYAACCELYHLGLANNLFAPDAEALMRSRYTAYVFGLEGYLLQTWHPDTRPSALNLADDLTGNLATKWLGLQVKHFEQYDENHATVEFIARYKIAGKAERLYEISQFVKIKQQWLYVDGKHTP